MSYHSHKLNSSHSHIIARKDPITGDSVQENDSVVFCAACQSCFLEDSWIYMNERHCEQSQTLETVPTLPSQFIFKTRDEKLISEIKISTIDLNIVIPAVILTFIISFSGLIDLDMDMGIGISFMITLFFSGFTGIFYALLTLTEGYRKFIGTDKNNVRIFKNRIEIGKDSFLWDNIKQIKYQRKRNIDIPSLLIYFENGEFLSKKLPIKDSNQAETFLKGLEKVSHFVEVFFYSENPYELRTMKNIQAQSKGNIEVGEINRLEELEGRETRQQSEVREQPELLDYYGRFINMRN